MLPNQRKGRPPVAESAMGRALLCCSGPPGPKRREIAPHPLCCHGGRFSHRWGWFFPPLPWSPWIWGGPGPGRATTAPPSPRRRSGPARRRAPGRLGRWPKRRAISPNLLPTGRWAAFPFFDGLDSGPRFASSVGFQRKRQRTAALQKAAEGCRTRALPCASSQQGETSLPAYGLKPVTEGKCVSVRRGGKQPEVNEQSGG